MSTSRTTARSADTPLQGGTVPSDAPVSATTIPSAEFPDRSATVRRQVSADSLAEVSQGARGLAPGTLVSPYRVVRLVGRGGMGDVYLARDTQLGRKVALKVVRPSVVGNREEVARFLLEARITARFNHPHIVTVYGAGEFEGQPYVALEYLEGQTLRARMDEQRLGVR
ncbi:MAG TPA: protein kinase, partial [Polyangiaceae bacterium]|nr:protein kinase [Polyangiaceae bacterium]